MDQKTDQKRHDALSIPNLITYFRLVLVPVFVVFYFNRQYALAIVTLVLSGLSDVADGYIARHCDMVTDIGKVIDPVADKLTQAAMLFCVAWSIPAMWVLFAFLVIKELVMLMWGAVTLRLTGAVHSAKWYGKVCTFVLYASMALLVLYRDWSETAQYVIMGVCGGVMLMSLLLYSLWYIRLLWGRKGVRPRRPVEHNALHAQISTVMTEIIVTILLVCAALAFVHRHDLTVEAIVSFTPENLWLAALVFMGLYAAKSLTVVVYLKLLYVAAGVVFPLPVAIAVNIVGSVVELTIPYLIGLGGGQHMAEAILERHPRLQRVTRLRMRNDFLYALFLRAVGVLPVDPIGIYFGACRMDYGTFITSGILGLLPAMLVATVMGVEAQDPASPAFITSTVLFVFVHGAAIIGFCVWVRKCGRAEQQEVESVESAE